MHHRWCYFTQLFILFILKGTWTIVVVYISKTITGYKEFLSSRRTKIYVGYCQVIFFSNIPFSVRKSEDTKGVIRSHKSKNRQYNVQKNNQWSTKNCTENERSSNTNPTKKQGQIQVFLKGKWFLHNLWHLSCYSCYKPGTIRLFVGFMSLNL